LAKSHFVSKILEDDENYRASKLYVHFLFWTKHSSNDIPITGTCLNDISNGTTIAFYRSYVKNKSRTYSYNVDWATNYAIVESNKESKEMGQC